ncbi:MAG: hypothetical protein K2X81_00725 [Candidatus Obscuribacterales bacterium]|nr:hypothetical protein [Candidatus Obscuribacterales bacterium]
MVNNSNSAGPGGAVAEDDKKMSYPNQEQIGSIESELEKTEREFRKASEAKDFAAMMQNHNRLCQLVAKLSAAWSGGNPTVFARFHVPPTVQAPAVAAAVAPAVAPAASTMPTWTASPTDPVEHTPPATPATTSSSAGPQAQAVAPAAGSDADIPEVSVLEKQLAELASKMQQCIEAGDMDGMLKASEKMGTLSELLTKAEAIQKEKKKAEAAKSLPSAPAKVEQTQSNPASASPGGWSAGDTLTLAKQRAEERKKQQKLNDSMNDSFEIVVGQVVDKPVAEAGAKPNEEPSSTVDMLFNDKMKSKVSGQAAKPAKKMTQEQLREKLEGYSFYEILAIPSTASFEELHKSFFKKIRKLNKKLANQTLDMWQFQEFVASLCLAHDVLKYPNARLQDVLVLFGPADGGSSAETTSKQKMMPLKELFKFSTLINGKELAEAIEKHKGISDERELGHYLVDKGLLSVDELDSILFAQKLVSAGKLTVAQFELAMQEMRENSIPLLDTLVASEWIRPQDVFSGEFL